MSMIFEVWMVTVHYISVMQGRGALAPPGDITESRQNYQSIQRVFQMHRRIVDCPIGAQVKKAELERITLCLGLA